MRWCQSISSDYWEALEGHGQAWRLARRAHPESLPPYDCRACGAIYAGSYWYVPPGGASEHGRYLCRNCLPDDILLLLTFMPDRPEPLNERR